MLMVFMIPKRNSGKTLFTMGHALTAEQIADKPREWYKPGAECYDEDLLIKDWDGDERYMLDPDYCYLTIDADEAMDKFWPIVENQQKKDSYLYNVAASIVSLIVGADDVVISREKPPIIDFLKKHGYKFYR